MMRRALLVVFLLVSLAGCNGSEKPRTAAGTGRSADRGRQLIPKYGCDACHAIPGVQGVQGMVGPSLQHMASRPTIAGKYPNNAQTMAKWIQNPQTLDPQSAMPNMNVTPADAKDISAYLFTLR